MDPYPRGGPCTQFGLCLAFDLGLGLDLGLAIPPALGAFPFQRSAAHASRAFAFDLPLDALQLATATKPPVNIARTMCRIYLFLTENEIETDTHAIQHDLELEIAIAV
jgi:hypothetical protein